MDESRETLKAGSRLFQHLFDGTLTRQTNSRRDARFHTFHGPVSASSSGPSEGKPQRFALWWQRCNAEGGNLLN